MPPGGGSSDGPAPGGRGFPALGLISQRQDGRYLLTRSDEGETLEGVSPFLIDEAIKNCCGDVASVKRIREGKILIQTHNEKQANQLKKLTSLIDGVTITISEHATLNTCKVVITCHDLKDIDEKEILQELNGQKVTHVQQIKRKANGQLIKTPSFILTISSTIRPERVKVGFLSVPARSYYPRPVSCFQCWRIGHLAREFRREKTFVNCSEEYHGEECSKPSKCVNCNGNHPANNPKCDVWNTEMDIIRTKIDQENSSAEARKIVESRKQTEQTYASRFIGTEKTCTCKCTCGQVAKAEGSTTNTKASTSSEINSSQIPTKLNDIIPPSSPRTKRAKQDGKTSDDETPATQKTVRKQMDNDKPDPEAMDRVRWNYKSPKCTTHPLHIQTRNHQPWYLGISKVSGQESLN
ncbi:uncharacterized protein LOC129719609 [Wyeomyia smithii]|uniref:uncharacterized protein LOC129719609 n=1 Tax=Wyeomyia smithii TaxID=174621 RepID=UPI002467D797|nr:uncharacterized protein LOC129719609 [Wyeomyia smithii]